MSRTSLGAIQQLMTCDVTLMDDWRETQGSLLGLPLLLPAAVDVPRSLSFSGTCEWVFQCKLLHQCLEKLNLKMGKILSPL